MSFTREAQRLRSRLAARRRALRLARLVWLAPLPALLGLLAEGLGRPVPLGPALMATSLLAAVGLAWALWPMDPLPRLVRRAEAALGLQDAWSTALERESAGGQLNSVERRLSLVAQVEAAAALHRLGSLPPAWRREVAGWAGTALLLLAVLLPALPGRGAVWEPPLLPLALSPPSLLGVPGMLPAPETAGSRAQPQAHFTDPASRSEALRALRQALADEAAARGAVDALAEDDSYGAARELRELADRLEDLSPPARERLASSLRRAAESLRGDSPELAWELEEAARAIEEGREAGRALEELARALEAQLPPGGQYPEEGVPGQSPAGRADPASGEAAGMLGGSLEDPGGPARRGGLGGSSGTAQAEPSRLGVEGVEVGLARGVIPPGLEPLGRGQAESVEGKPEIRQEVGSVSGGLVSTAPIRAPADLLALPSWLRGALLRYWTP